MKFRIGQGIDFHRLESGRKLWLGGIPIPSEKGCVAHSDGDVLIHAICDGLLGAAGLRDIGYYFPDNSDEFKGIDSKILLEKVIALIGESGYKIGNIDVTLCLEKPKIAPYIPHIKETLAGILKISTGDLSIKATTNEQLGYVGREEGVCAYAVALIQKGE